MPYNPSTIPAQPGFTPPGAGGLTQPIVTTLYDRPRFEFMDVMNRHVGLKTFATWLKAYGWSNGVSNPSVGHYERPFTENVVQFTVVTDATAAGGNMTIQLTANQHVASAANVNGTATSMSLPQVGDVFEVSNAARTQVYVVDKLTTGAQATAHRLVIRPVNSAVNIGAGGASAGTQVTASHRLFLVANHRGEGTKAPTSRPNLIIKYSNSFAIVKEAFYITGSEMTNDLNFSINGGDNSMYYMLENVTVENFERRRGNTLLFGQPINNVTVLSEAGSDVPVSGTEGFTTYASLYGFTDTFTAGSYTTAELDQIGAYMTNQRANRTGIVCAWSGYNFRLQVENAFQNLLVQNLAPFVQSLMGSEAYSQYQGYYNQTQFNQGSEYHFGINAVTKGGYTYVFQQLDDFNAGDGAGFVGTDAASTFAYVNMAIFTPHGEAIDKSTGNPRPHIGYEYKKRGNYSREAVVSPLAGAGVGGVNTPFGNAVNDIDMYGHILVSEIAAHMALGNKLVVQRPA